MTLAIRLEKLRFLAMEMELTLHLSKSAPTDADARMLIRHVLIRAENFITHTRQLRKPLNAAGIDTRKFHELKEYYAKEFDEYFHATRDRLSAHVQDIDFGKRIELWNDIEASKSGFFSESAVEIYQGLENQNIPGYISYREFPETKDRSFKQALVTYRASGNTRHRVEIGSDPLAMTRPNTGAALNFTPIHSRASQITLIHRWMKAQADLLQRFEAYPNVSRILKVRAITDLVSFCDCLITRPVAAKSPQEMEGLDRLINSQKITPNPVDQFKISYDVEAAITPYRIVRDKLGGHLESNPSVGLNALLRSIDETDMRGALSLYDTLWNVFEKTCRQIIFLSGYLADGREMYGLGGMSTGDAIVSFDPSSEGRTITTPDVPPITDAEFTQKLEIWISGPDEDRGYIRSIFYQASFESAVIEQFVWPEHQSANRKHYRHHSFRTVHRFLLNRLQSETDANRILGILELMRQCANGDPDGMTEVLLRFAQTERSAPYHAALACCFGDLAKWTNGKVRNFLMSGLTRPHPLAIYSRIALLKIFVRTEGLIRINRKTETESFDEATGVLTVGMNEQQQLFNQIILASQFCNPEIATYLRVFDKEYNQIRLQIVSLAETLAPKDKTVSVKEMTQRLVDTQDFVGVALFLNDEFKGGPNETLTKDLIRLACDGAIIASQHDQSRKHLCGCFLRHDLLPQALAIATNLAAGNPENVDYQILKIQIMAEMHDGIGPAQKIAAEIERYYGLSDDQIRIIESIKMCSFNENFLPRDKEESSNDGA